jgi:nephrocystin-3
MNTTSADHAPLSREIRVFLSSTFRDMDAERSFLIKQVFPKVRAACMARQVGFTEIDLRWGVTEDEAKNGATVEICLREIDRCRDFPPFFIGFLGERYGWIPQHDDLIAYWDKHADTDYERTIRHAIERTISVTELEMELAVLASGAAEKLHDQALFLLRDRALTDALYQRDTGKAPNPHDASYYDDGEGKLATLKSQIRATPFLGIDGYTSVEQFGQTIEDYLLAQLDRLFPLAKVPSPLERQRAAHTAFRFHRLQNFVPRTDVRAKLLTAIKRHIAEPHLGPILLAGPSGQGKSALMADLAQHIEIEHPNWLVLDHYTGADDANHLESWVRRILETLHLRIAHLVDGIPDTPKDQKKALSTWIAIACRKSEQDAGRPGDSTKLILILDAIDQNSDGGKQLDLLKPEVMGPDAVVVASAADGTPAREAAGAFEAILVPPLTAALKTQMVTDTLGRFKKKLPVTLAKRLASAKQSGSPLFLGLALEELRIDARHKTLKSLIDDILTTQSAEELFLKNFLLDADYGRPDLPTLAVAFMALLGASHAGLTELELADLLANRDDRKAGDTKKPRLPQGHLSRLLTNLGPFLLNKNGRRAPMHRIFGEAAMQYYGTTPVREHLYRHFRSGYGKGKQPFVAGAATEALFQATRLADVPEGKRRLANDVANLPAMAKLREADENLVADALAQFTFDEKSTLGMRWGRQVVPENVKARERTFDHFSAWINSRIGHCSATLAIQEPLLTVRRQLFGDEHQDTLNSMTALCFTRGRGDLSKAKELAETVLEVHRRRLGEESPRTHISMSILARILEAQGDFSGAQALLELVLAATRRRLGDDHAITLTAISNLADTLHAQGNQSGAQPLRKEAMDISLRRFGENHTATLHFMAELALSFVASNRLPEAHALQERAITGLCQRLGNDHPETLSRMMELARTLACMGDLEGSTRILESVLNSRRRTLSQEHPDVLNSIQDLASSLRQSNQLGRASLLQDEALGRFVLVYGEGSLEAARAYSEMGQLLTMKGEVSEAEALLRKALTILERELGTDHSATQVGRIRLDEVLNIRPNKEH